MGSVFGAFNLQVVAPLLKVYNEGIFLFLSNVITYFVAIFAMILYGEPFVFGTDPLLGLFGFVHIKYEIFILKA